MQFGDRFCESLSDHAERWRVYRKHLKACGYSRADPEYLLFGGEVFHDRPILVSGADVPAGEVSIQLVNAFALNRVATEIGSLPNWEDFVIVARFSAVTLFKVEGLNALSKPIYYQAELTRRAANTTLRIEVRDASDANEPGIGICVEYGSVDFGDVHAGARKYIKGAGDGFVSSMMNDPENPGGSSS